MDGLVGNGATELGQQPGSMLLLHDENGMRPSYVVDGYMPARIGASPRGPCADVWVIAPDGLRCGASPLVAAADKQNIQRFVVFGLAVARCAGIVDAKLFGASELCRAKIEKLPVLLTPFFRLDMVVFHEA